MCVVGCRILFRTKHHRTTPDIRAQQTIPNVKLCSEHFSNAGQTDLFHGAPRFMEMLRHWARGDREIEWEINKIHNLYTAAAQAE